MVVLSLLQIHPYTCCAGSIKQQHPNAPHRLGRCLRAQLVDSQQLAPSTASSSSSYDSEPVAGVLLDIDGGLHRTGSTGSALHPPHKHHHLTASAALGPISLLLTKQLDGIEQQHTFVAGVHYTIMVP